MERPQPQEGGRSAPGATMRPHGAFGHRSAIRCTLVAAVCAALLAPSALAHGGGGGKKGYHSTVVRLVPASPFIHITVVDSDDRLQMRVDGDHTVVIDGYEGEPYLRFSPGGVYRNARSPATYLNDDRYGTVRLPVRASPTAAPEWVSVAPGGRTYEWHDHRIHWMSTSDPPVVVAERSRLHRIFDWRVPGTLDDRRLAVHGRLDYAPIPGQRFPRLLVVPLIALALLAVALPLMRRRTAQDGKVPRPSTIDDGKDSPK
jgi:hypothetical protein